jgi:hypothetical protein
LRNPKFHALLEEVATLSDAKNHDYAHEADPLSNFRQATQFGLTPLQGVFVRMGDKYARLSQLASGKVPKNESMRDTLIDLAVYSLIAVLLLDEHTAVNQVIIPPILKHVQAEYARTDGHGIAIAPV